MVVATALLGMVTMILTTLERAPARDGHPALGRRTTAHHSGIADGGGAGVLTLAGHCARHRPSLRRLVGLAALCGHDLRPASADRCAKAGRVGSAGSSASRSPAASRACCQRWRAYRLSRGGWNDGEDVRSERLLMRTAPTAAILLGALSAAACGMVASRLQTVGRGLEPEMGPARAAGAAQTARSAFFSRQADDRVPSAPEHAPSATQPLVEGRWMSAPSAVQRQPGTAVVAGPSTASGSRSAATSCRSTSSATRVKEFLLVPFVGACIHVPPPPQPDRPRQG